MTVAAAVVSSQASSELAAPGQRSSTVAPSIVMRSRAFVLAGPVRIANDRSRGADRELRRRQPAVRHSRRRRSTTSQTLPGTAGGRVRGDARIRFLDGAGECQLLRRVVLLQPWCARPERRYGQEQQRRESLHDAP